MKDGGTQESSADLAGDAAEKEKKSKLIKNFSLKHTTDYETIV